VFDVSLSVGAVGMLKPLTQIVSFSFTGAITKKLPFKKNLKAFGLNEAK
jgi:hypothetical protein